MTSTRTLLTIRLKRKILAVSLARAVHSWPTESANFVYLARRAADSTNVRFGKAVITLAHRVCRSEMNSSYGLTTKWNRAEKWPGEVLLALGRTRIPGATCFSHARDPSHIAELFCGVWRLTPPVHSVQCLWTSSKESSFYAGGRCNVTLVASAPMSLAKWFRRE